MGSPQNLLGNRIKSPPFRWGLQVFETLRWKFWLLFLFCCIIQAVQLTSTGCSHTKPYYHPEIPDIERRESETEGVLRYRLLLLGDGGAPRPDEPVLKTLGEWAETGRCENKYHLFRGQYVSRGDDRTPKT